MFEIENCRQDDCGDPICTVVTIDPFIGSKEHKKWQCISRKNRLRAMNEFEKCLLKEHWDLEKEKQGKKCFTPDVSEIDSKK